MATVYGYCRVSTEAQAESGLSLKEQRHQIDTHAAALAARHCLSIGSVVSDKAVSGSKTVFRNRPQSGKLLKKLKRGDHLVIAKLDRGFRSTRDCLQTLETLRSRDVTVHLLDIGVDTSQPSGKLLITIMAALAEWEAERIGDRIRDAIRARRRSAPGKAVSAVRVVGYSIDKHHVLTPHAEERAAGKIAAGLRSSGQTLQAIADELNRQGYVRPGNPFGPRDQRSDRPWTRHSIHTLISRHRQGYPMYPREAGASTS